MERGVKFRAFPTSEQKVTLSRWIGIRRFIWNAKCDEERYHRAFARKFCAIGTFAPIDKTYAQFRSDELTPWLSEAPAEILKDAACKWTETFQKFIRGEGGRPRRKRKGYRGSVWLEKRLFQFENRELWIGTGKHPVGKLRFQAHRPWKEPKSVTIACEGGDWYVSFSYDDGAPSDELQTQIDQLSYLRTRSEGELRAMVVGIDRGVAIPVQAGEVAYDYTPGQKARMVREERNRKRYQRRMGQQMKGSRRRGKSKQRLAKSHLKTKNIRNDFAHKTSHHLVEKTAKHVYVFEDLKTRQMTARSKARPVKDESGKVVRFEKNRAAQKAGLNKAILNVGWHQIELYTHYKAERAGKAWFRIPAFYTSQTCAACDHTSPDSRRSQAEFVCVQCGHQDNADHNAQAVIAKQAIKLILDPGTGLSKRGVLLASAVDVEPTVSRYGRKATSQRAKSTAATSRKKRQKRKGCVSSPEAIPFRGW